MYNIRLEDLDGRCTQDTQEKCIKAILADSKFNPKRLVLPVNSLCFQNASAILLEMPIKRLIPIAADLLEWAQDLNWPGGKTVIAIISKMPTNVVSNAFAKAKERAISENDDEWLHNLNLLEDSEYRNSFVSETHENGNSEFKKHIINQLDALNK
jgi:hypothetical protein